jgi:hypothetical protein
MFLHDKIGTMATRAALHRMVDELLDPQVPMARIVVDDPPADRAQNGDPNGIDEWGDLSATTDEAAARTLRRLDEDERAAGHQPWQG